MDKFKSIYIILVTLLFGVLATYIVCDKVTIVEDLGYKNIVNIIGGVFGQENTSGSHDPRFIDIEGHIFN